MKKRFAMAALGLVALPLCGWAAGEWSNLDDAHYISGPKLSADRFKGRIVFVERWGLHCGPCLASLPHVQSLYDKYSKKGVIFIGAHCQEFDKPGILAAVKNGGVGYSVYQGAGHRDAPKAGGIPAPYLVGADGKVCWSATGFRAEAAEAAIEKAVKAAPNLMHDVMIDEVRAHLETRPGYAKLRLQEFDKAFPKERTKLAEERKKLSAPGVSSLLAVEKECARLRDMKVPNDSIARKRNADIDKALAKAKRLNCAPLEQELESLKSK